MIALGVRVTGTGLAIKIVETFLILHFPEMKDILVEFDKLRNRGDNREKLCNKK